MRIGAATAKGLAFSRPELICVGVSTLEALALNLSAFPTGRILLPVMDARRNQFYHAFFRTSKTEHVKRLSEDMLLTHEEVVEEAKERFSGKNSLLSATVRSCSIHFAANSRQKILMFHFAARMYGMRMLFRWRGVP